MMRRLLTLTAFIAAVSGSPSRAETTLNAVLEAEIVTLDPHFTGAYISRTFGYMVYDTLFAPDSTGSMQPQMVGDWSVSDDKLTWRFTLRDGLAFHDGARVTADDVVASLRRWSTRNALGGRLFAVIASLEPTNATTFTLVLRAPYGLVLETLGTTLGPVPFIIPGRLAATPGSQQIKEVVGSGPFTYSSAAHQPGNHMLLRRNPGYVARPEPADFLAGGHVVNVDAVDFRIIPDGATAAAALQRGEVDYLQYVPFDLIPLLRKNSAIRVLNFTGAHMFTGQYRFNLIQKPFDDPAIRRVVLGLVDQQEVLDGLGLEPSAAQTCPSFFICGSPYATPNPGLPTNHSIVAARSALAKTNYANEPIVVMVASDIEVPRVASTILASRLSQAGFKVDVQVMDWATLLQRRMQRTGWSIYGVHALGLDLQSLLTNTAVNGNCLEAPSAGYLCDRTLTPLFEKFAQSPGLALQRETAGQIQAVVTEQAIGATFGQFAQPAAFRTNISNVAASAIPLFWNLQKK